MTSAHQPIRGPGFWGRANRALMAAAGGWFRLRHAVQRRRLKPIATPTVDPRDTGEAAHLVLSWGRLGDAVLARGWLQRLRAGLPGRVILLGRPETKALVADLVDAFVPLQGDIKEVAEAVSSCGPFRCGITDVHWFHGGELRFPGLFGSLPIEHRIGFAGYAPVDRVAPVRPWPRNVELLAPPPAPPTGHPQPHILEAQQRYLHGIATRLERVGIWRGHIPPQDAAIPPSVPVAWGTWQPGKGPVRIACQPAANIAKKDLPADVWREVFAAVPEAEFLLLGTAAQQEALTAMADGARVRSLAGRTTLPEVAELLRGCDAFVGVDSGLAHMACALGVPTVVVSPNNNLGAFFPWPGAYRKGPQWVDLSDTHMDCAGCFTSCLREPVWRGRKHGLPCIRGRNPAGISAGLLQVMGRSGPAAEGAHSGLRTALDSPGNCKRSLQTAFPPA